MLLRRLLATVSLSVLIAVAPSLPIPAWASEEFGFQPVSPDELKMTTEPLAPGAPAIILYRRVDRDDNGRTSHQDNYFRIKILTEEGRKQANIEIPGNATRYTRVLEIKELSVPVNKADDLKKFYRFIATDERNTAVLKTSN